MSEKWQDQMDGLLMGPSVLLKGYFDQSKDCNILIFSAVTSERV